MLKVQPALALQVHKVLQDLMVLRELLEPKVLLVAEAVVEQVHKVMMVHWGCWSPRCRRCTG